jgi:hypothetical protein
MTATSINVDQRSLNSVMAQINRASKELGRDMKGTVKWAGRMVAQSLSAATKIAPKLRPIVENPNPAYKTDKRFAPYGVMKYKNGKPYFAPIFRTGEFGRVRFVDKKTAEIKYVNTLTGKVQRADTVAQQPGLSIKSDKRRIIGRRGLAKKTWSGLSKVFDSAVIVQGIKSGSSKMSGGDNNPTLTLTNSLNYAGAAFKGNAEQAVSEALMKASFRMQHLISKAIAKKMGAK